MKSVQFIYEDTEIHFLVNPDQENVMVNATEMAKAFGKETREFLRNQNTKSFIQIAETEPYSVGNYPPNNLKMIENRSRNGVYFHRILALKFAAWLDPKFEFWVFSTLDELMFGHYKKHWEAHTRQEAARLKMETLKQKMLTAPTAEMVIEYFEAELSFNTSKYEKSKAIRNQLSLFDQKD